MQISKSIILYLFSVLVYFLEVVNFSADTYFSLALLYLNKKCPNAFLVVKFEQTESSQLEENTVYVIIKMSCS